MLTLHCIHPASGLDFHVDVNPTEFTLTSAVLLHDMGYIVELSSK